MPAHRLEPMDLRKLPYLVVPGVALAMVLFALTRLIEPLPPRVITLSTGREGAAYHLFAREYRKLAVADGFTVEIQPGAGSVETLKLLGRLPEERSGSSSTSVMPSCCSSRMIGKSSTASGPSSRRRISGDD